MYLLRFIPIIYESIFMLLAVFMLSVSYFSHIPAQD